MLTVGLFAVALLLGGMVFFAAICAPVTFTALDAPNAAKHTRAIFPRYYLFVGGLAALAAVALALPRPTEALLMASVAAVAAWLRQVLMPRMNPWRDAELAGDAVAGRKFATAHKASVAINMAQMALAAVVLFLLGSGMR
jgi:uncharacterized membrane protein